MLGIDPIRILSDSEYFSAYRAMRAFYVGIPDFGACDFILKGASYPLKTFVLGEPRVATIAEFSICKGTIYWEVSVASQRLIGNPDDFSLNRLSSCLCLQKFVPKFYRRKHKVPREIPPMIIREENERLNRTTKRQIMMAAASQYLVVANVANQILGGENLLTENNS